MSRQTTSTVLQWLTTLVALALLFCLASCEMPPPTTGQTATRQTTDDQTQPGPEPVDPNKPVAVLIHRIDLPLEASLDDCWAQVDETALHPLTYGMWQTNGMRIGVLHSDHAQAFAEALPATLGESRAKLLGSKYPTAIRSTPRLLEPVPVDLTDPPRSPTIYRATDGRLQLLTKVMRFPETGQPYVEITPHHYKPKADLIPRSPLEKALDGKVFTPLTARVPLTANTAVVVGLYRPRPETEPADEITTETTENKVQQTKDEPNAPTNGPTETSTDESSNQESEIKNQQPPSPPIPDSLGKSLMAGIRAGYETQILIVITVIEE